MRLKRNYYEVMGLSRNATDVEVKLKYHELARIYHPDRAKDKELAQRLFSQINLAYKTLSNQAERSRYDDILDAEAAAARMFPSVHSHSASASTGVQTAHPVAPRPPSQPDRTNAPDGGSVARPTPTSPLSSAARPVSSSHHQAPRPGLAQALEQAFAAYGRGDLGRALNICRQIIAADSDNFDALRLMGDIHADSFRNVEALSAYRRALKVQPRNFTMQDKVKKLQAVVADITLNGQQTLPKPGSRNGFDTPSGAKAGKKVSIFKRILGG
jgi:curved DNA-binding protein CbpA